MARLLVIDDDPRPYQDLMTIREPCWQVSHAATGGEGIRLTLELEPDVVLLDLNLPDMSGIEVLAALDHRRMPVVMLTAYGDAHLVVEAVRAGAFDYVVKGDDFGPLVDAIRRAIAAAAFRSIGAGAGADMGPTRIVGSGPAARRLREQIQSCARSDAPVCIFGESGTGKELVAEAIHRLSARHEGPFVALNCGALPELLVETELFGAVRGAFTDATDRAGAFERAQAGTLFLDEIAEMPKSSQVKLLRAVESKRVRRVGGEVEKGLDVRIITATNRDLKAGVAEGTFRGDLFYRIGVLPVSVPALRDRPEDIPVLAAHFLAQLAPPDQPVILSPEAAELLMSHPWPGNVRELRNVMERAIAYGGSVGPKVRVLDAASIIFY